MDAQEIDKIRELVKKHLNNCEFQIVELQLKGGGGRNILRILIDRKNGGISMAECTKLNEEIGLLLDKSDLLQEGYLLEVSSPGADRPLVTKEDFERKKGKTVRIKTKEALYEEKRKFIGVIVDVEEEAVIIKTEDRETKKIPFKLIKTSKIKLKW